MQHKKRLGDRRAVCQRRFRHSLQLALHAHFTERLPKALAWGAEWRNDYRAMKNELFFGAVPAFDEILRVVGGFERQVNAAVRPPVSRVCWPLRRADFNPNSDRRRPILTGAVIHRNWTPTRLIPLPVFFPIVT